MCRMQKVIIVEGKTDQRRLEEVLAEPVTFLLTHGTLGEEELLRRLLPYEREDVYIFVDADEPGNRLRRLLGRWFPRAKHLYTRKIYREIAHTPSHTSPACSTRHTSPCARSGSWPGNGGQREGTGKAEEKEP